MYDTWHVTKTVLCTFTTHTTESNHHNLVKLTQLAVAYPVTMSLRCPCVEMYSNSKWMEVDQIQCEFKLINCIFYAQLVVPLTLSNPKRYYFQSVLGHERCQANKTLVLLGSQSPGLLSHLLNNKSGESIRPSYSSFAVSISFFFTATEDLRLANLCLDFNSSSHP